MRFIWTKEHTKGIIQLKEICKNLPKLAIPQDKDELVLYTDASDHWWAAVLMKLTPEGEQPCRYCSGLFYDNEAIRWHMNEKEFFVVKKAFEKWPLFLLAKKFTLKTYKLQVKAFLSKKIESKPVTPRFS